jgi:plastocyanin
VVDPETRGLANVVILVDGVSGGEAPEAAAPVVANRDCAFVPHVQAVVKGAEVAIVNEDPISHTTHPRQQEDDHSIFNVPLSPEGSAGDRKERPFRRSGVVKLKCDVHEWMEGWLVVHDNAYFAVSDAQGRFAIDKLPAGTHQVRAWHETFGTRNAEILVEDGRDASLDFEFDGASSP